MIGAKQITLLDNTTNEGRQCLARFDMVRDAILEMFPWSFTRKQAELVQMAEVAKFGYSYSYALPTDCLRPLRINQDAKYEIVGKKLFTDSEEISLWYVGKTPDPTQFTPLFDVLLASRLAKDMAMTLTGNKAALSNATNEYTQAFIEAVDINADYDEEVDESTSYVDVRS